MRTSDLDAEEIEAIDKTAVLIYTSKPGGQSSVHQFAEMLGWEEYADCEPCEDKSPMLNGCCFVCGTPVK